MTCSSRYYLWNEIQQAVKMTELDSADERPGYMIWESQSGAENSGTENEWLLFELTASCTVSEVGLIQQANGRYAPRSIKTVRIGVGDDPSTVCDVYETQLPPTNLGGEHRGGGPCTPFHIMLPPAVRTRGKFVRLFFVDSWKESDFAPDLVQAAQTDSGQLPISLHSHDWIAVAKVTFKGAA